MKRTHPGRPRVDDDDVSEKLCLTLPSKQYDALDREAKIARVTAQDIIRRALHERAEKRYPK
jgi:hypothetical protein